MISPRAFALFAVFGAGVARATLQRPFASPLDVSWDELREKVDGRLYAGSPWAKPCFDDPESDACREIRLNYRDEASRASSSGAYINTQWETCQSTREQCLLDYTNPRDKSAISSPYSCSLGSVSDYYIDVREPKDVTAAFEFSKRTHIPVIVKNSGHDYKGRSSAPRSLGLWTRNLKNMTYNPKFVPKGCDKASAGVTLGAGVAWGEAYEFAEENNITVVGGSDKTVGAVGGWLQGGGHGALSNTMGMGVDRVLEFEVVTPDGQLRTANACQNEDLFFALRGGGGGTFGVVTSATILASPQVTLQTIIVAFPRNDKRARQLFTVMVDNGLAWAAAGWGGLANAQAAIYVNPVLNKEEAAESMKPLIELGERLKREGGEPVQVVVREFGSWGGFFHAFAGEYVAAVGASLALSSRLIPKDNFVQAEDRKALVDAFVAADSSTPGLIVLISPPTSYKGDTGRTSVTEAWRNSIYHITVISPWNWNATTVEKSEHYARASASIDHLRRLTPDAAYVNEADVYEANHEIAFWGSNYPELLKIKQKYDPDHLLDCWQCVGWKPESKRFACYLPQNVSITSV
ncbi:hypothetical protein HGRIS_006163 [Hohenbuehelia grisea]|uniref:FAD-binding PCMH-type domain-containing protein n=1 Tax=Hohenbuehelia grisea TaxID=104357 RepID=A0ABR3K013_9AGAR